MTHSGDSQHLSPAISIIAKRPMNKVVLVTMIKVTYGLDDMDCYSVRLTKTLGGASHKP